MSWQRLLAEGRIQPHAPTKRELDGLRDVIRRDLADSAVRQISDDRRFATAYNAALQTLTMVLACSGYRTTGQGHHKTTIEALPLAMGQGVLATATLMDQCRRKRNRVDYDRVGMASAAEADQLLQEATSLLAQVEAWIAVNFPHLA